MSVNIKIMTIEDTHQNPIWGGLSHLLTCIATVILLLGLVVSFKISNSDIETISRVWHGQTECKDMKDIDNGQ